MRLLLLLQHKFLNNYEQLLKHIQQEDLPVLFYYYRSRKDDIVNQMESFYIKQDAYKSDLAAKSVIDTHNTEEMSILLCLGQQKKFRVTIKILTTELEDMFAKDFSSYFLSPTYKRMLDQLEDNKLSASRDFLDCVTLRGAYVNLTHRTSEDLLPKSRFDDILRYRSELYF